MSDEVKQEQAVFDPLDMNNYRIEKLPKMAKSNFEKWMARLGGPLAILAFVLIYFFGHFGFIDHLDPDSLSAKALARCSSVPTVRPSVRSSIRSYIWQASTNRSSGGSSGVFGAYCSFQRRSKR